MELLAPASNMVAALTAFDAGADAVYVGLPKFNARERGENLSMDEISRLVYYARRKRKKVYITLNTLIKETELAEIVAILAELTKIRPHAIIVQDIGLVHLIRQHFPELVIHASTQMGVHNSAGVNLLKRMGVERVILERQITFDEIKVIRAETDLELEVFIHGALCCCRSGTCLFSSWLGGWSGNRGKCKQPCRRRFYSDSGNGFFFSTNDLYSLDAIPDLKKMGICSFKIEGRLRKADYVRSVVTAYRMMLDANDETESKTLGEAKRVLSEALGRKWSEGFRTEDGFDKVIQHERMGVSGLVIGKVTSTRSNGFDAHLSRPLSIGDRIRVQATTGDEGPGITITKLSKDGRSTNYVGRNAVCFVHCDKDVPKGGRIFLTGRAEPDLSVRIAEMHPQTVVLDLDIAVMQTKISIQVQNLPKLNWVAKLALADAEKRPLHEATVAEEFAKTTTDGFSTERVNVNVYGDYFMPAKELKSIRRAFWKWVDEHVQPGIVGALLQARVKECLESLKEELRVGRAPESVIILGKDGTTDKDACVARQINEWQDDAQEVVLPDFCPERQLPGLREQIEELLAQGIKRFRVTSLYGIELLRSFRRRDLELTAGFPFPITNSEALRELSQLGISKACAWVELEKEALEALIAKAPQMVEVLAYGRIPILSTRAKLPIAGEIRDDRGNTYKLQPEGELLQLYPAPPIAIPSEIVTHRCVDLTHAEPDEDDTSSFNYGHDLV